MLLAMGQINTVNSGTVNSGPPCVLWDHSLLGQFCFESDPLFKLGGHQHQLPIPRYAVFVLGVILVFLALSAIMYVRRSKHSAGAPIDKTESPKIAMWVTLFTVVVLIWTYTALEAGQGIWVLLRFAVALLVVPLILVIEGLFLSVLALEDKELPERLETVENIGQARNIVAEYLVDQGGYLRAREWLVAGLIILLTMAVEFDKYRIPLVGTYEGPLARVFFTGFFATIAIIWTAQTPGKEIGKNNPVRFLCLWLGPEQIHKLLLKISHLAKRSCIDKPSRAAAGMIEVFLHLSTEPSLAPGGSRFFAELIKRYGYGDCRIKEEYTIDDSGAAELKQTEIVYLGFEKEQSYVRHIYSEVPFKVEPIVTSVEAFVIPALSASLETDMKKWENPWGSGYTKVRKRDVDTFVTWLDQDMHTAQISIALPEDKITKNEAYLLLIEFSATVDAGGFKGPSCLGEDFWSRRLQRPCYQAETTLRLKNDKSLAGFRKVTFKAYQEEKKTMVPHLPETRRFRQLQKSEDQANQMKGNYTVDGVPDDGKTMSIKLTYGLPGVKYETRWEVTNKS